MTPQEEAQRVVDMFKPAVYPTIVGMYQSEEEIEKGVLSDAKCCAEIHLNELIKTLEQHGALVGAVTYREVKDKIDSTI